MGVRGRGGSRFLGEAAEYSTGVIERISRLFMVYTCLLRRKGWFVAMVIMRNERSAAFRT